jgi:GGDEF domain-containing protein
MVRIALILKNITRQIGHGWPIRFKSNEAGLIFYNCDAEHAEKIANELSKSIADMEPVPKNGDIEAFSFSASISWSVWPKDDAYWDSFFSGTYAALLDAWKEGGEKIVHYKKTAGNG